MLDINRIVNETKYVHDALTKKGFDVDFAPLIDMYNQRKQLIVKAEDLKKENRQCQLKWLIWTTSTAQERPLSSMR